MDRVQKWQFNVLILLVLSLLSVSALAEKQSKTIPKWKLEHQANVANSAKVCASPVINKRINPRNLTTGFYTIQLRQNTQPVFVEIDEQGQVGLQNAEPSHARRWLLTHIGGANYDIATCYQGQPVCLAIGANKHVSVASCDEVGYGDQTWWLKRYGSGQNKGAWFLGNDGIGQMECLETNAANPLFFQQCNDTTAWDISRVEKPTTSSLPQAAKDHAALAFPEGVDIIQYQCDSGSVVEAYYDIENDRVLVSYNDELRMLNATLSGSGAKYGDSKQLWGWWTKGQSGSIYQTDDDTEIFIENCTEVDSQAQAVSQTERIWHAQEFDDMAVVADCTDCEEDLGLVIRCNKGSLTAEVSVYLNADDAVNKQQLSMEAEIGESVYQYPIEAEYLEMIGHHIANFQIHKNDPILMALQHKKAAKFKVTNDTFAVGLLGRQQAIDDFKAYCGWDI